jgi:hypothetical protein
MRILPLVLLVVLSILMTGCGSIFQGYMSSVTIKNAPDSLKVYYSDGVEIPTKIKINKVRQSSLKGDIVTAEKPVSTTQIIELRSNKDHQIVLKSGSNERRYTAYAKLSPVWFTLDVLFAGLPVIYDAVTGNWNYFDEIDYNK